MWWNTSFIQILKFWKKCHVKITFLGQNWPKMVKNTCFCPKFVSLRYYSPINCTYPYVKLYYLSFDTQIIKIGESMEKWGLKEIPKIRHFYVKLRGQRKVRWPLTSPPTTDGTYEYRFQKLQTMVNANIWKIGGILFVK